MRTFSLSSQLLALLAGMAGALAMATILGGDGLFTLAREIVTTGNTTEVELGRGYAILEGISASQTSLQVILGQSDPDVIETKMADFTKSQDNIRGLIKECGAPCKEAHDKFEDLVLVNAKTIGLFLGGNLADAYASLATTVAPKLTAMMQAVRQYQQVSVTKIRAQNTSAGESAKTRALIVVLVSATAAIAISVVGALFRRGLSRRLASMVRSLNLIAKGDFAQKIPESPADELGVVGATVNRMSEHIGTLIKSIEQKNLELEGYSKSLEIKVSERTKAIRTILDHVSFGLLICDASLRIQPGYSDSCSQILDSGSRSLENMPLPELLRLDRRKAENFGLLYQQIFDPDFLLGELAVDQLPNRFQLEGRSIGLTGSVINDENGKAGGVLFCIADISNLVQAEVEIEKNRGLIKMLSNRDSFRQFVLDVKVGFETIYDSYKAKNDGLLRRELHTLKGNMGVYGLSELAGLIHVLEDDAVIKQADVRRVEESFKTFLNEHQELLGVTYGVASGGSFVIPENLVDRVETKAQSLADANELRNVFTDFFRMIRLKRARTVLGPIEESFAQLAMRLGKQAKLVVSGTDTLVPNGSIGIFKSLNHLLRNALDHGIEMPAERGPKGETGTIVLSVADSEDSLKIEVKDDGRGISRTLLGKKAIANGIVTETQLTKMTDEQVYDLIFLEGLSTAQGVTDISGRGVGMSAVKSAVEDAGGRIRIASQQGKGTVFTIEVPKVASCSWRPPTQVQPL